MQPRTAATLTLALLGGVVVWFFLAQNASRSTGLSLNLGFVAVALARPLPVAWLLLGAFGGGLVVGGGWGLARSWRAARTVARLEREAVSRDVGGRADGWG